MLWNLFRRNPNRERCRLMGAASILFNIGSETLRSRRKHLRMILGGRMWIVTAAIIEQMSADERFWKENLRE